jgi:putative salt-induced outer membrane protein YdiY
MSKATSFGNHKDESIMNLLKMQHKHQQQEIYGTRKSALNHTKNDEEINSNHESSLDKYENYMPYTRTDEVLDPGPVNSSISRSRETTPNKQTIEVCRKSQEF